ncbi:PhoH family protein [Thiospirochaeta perfilievii]|uniref:PhoH family protein n=1 Tax=Thiospirochaeta perfilievii TaxID=252967 RepID=A0A5C1QF67_9SPIO|nr:PhoH family protein [Thiospirochaeta perfilievii]QEN05699.1 PhoH family protein [Thiospirochaeta perfilievii]
MGDIDKNGRNAKINKDTKTFVIDTNVLIHRPDAIFSFKNSKVVIPIEVFEELDKLKSEHHSGRGKSARTAVRLIDGIISKRDVSKGVKMPSGGLLVIPILEDFKEFHGLVKGKKDNHILLTALALKQQGDLVFFVSKDINARIKAEALGIRAVDYEKHKVSTNDQYKGYVELEVSEDKCKELEEMKSVELEGNFYDNQYCFLTNSSSSTIYIGRYDKEAECFRHIPSNLEPVTGISALNTEQRIAFDALLNPNINLVTLVGAAGTGKTLLAIASGLHMVTFEKQYSRVLVSRPIVPMGNDIGFLPGEKSQKMSPWMQPIFDNLEFIIERSNKQNVKSVDQLINNKILEIEALTYIRGRSLPKQYIVVDEAQNLTTHEIKTIVSRAGEDTKVILTGDPYQIDNPYLDSESNGLITLVEAFKEEKISAHVTLTKTERSSLAELATQLL